ncbi:hypothetical protein ACFP1Z_32670 [Streptomyces gamaensis]|uniref:ATP-binding protein n=1 Tax=Streptomyces gamaensis TaxID=1763542 RepID=A0ABW0ZAL6_9ACTN
MESARWTPNKATTRILAQLRDWGFTADESAVGEVVILLVTEAVTGGQGRISVHMAPKDSQVLIAVRTHHPGQAPAGHSTVRQVAAHQVVAECGAHTSTEGPTVWALIGLSPPQRVPPQTTTASTTGLPTGR